MYCSIILQNVKEPELCFGQLDQSTEQTIRTMNTNITMRQSNLLLTDNGLPRKRKSNQAAGT
jgi:hypothetical protein